MLVAAAAPIALGAEREDSNGRAGRTSAPLTLTVRGVLHDGRRPIVVQGRRFTVAGWVKHPRRGERVVVRFLMDGEEVRRRRVAPGPGGVGRFKLRFASADRGRLRVVATREALPRARDAIHVLVARARIGPRSHGPLVRALQRRLGALRYSVHPTGVYDRRTGFAVLGYRGVNRLPRSDVADARVLSMLASGRGRYRSRFPHSGRHVEVDLSRRVLALLQGTRVVRVLHTSPGRQVTPTVLGSYRFYRKQPGRNASGMLHSNYFLRGYAVHGYDLVPQFPDSHGCLRIFTGDALFTYNWIRIGDRIDVYRSEGGAS